jgi:chromatin remodeling complex protein RSC6
MNCQSYLNFEMNQILTHHITKCFSKADSKPTIGLLGQDKEINMGSKGQARFHRERRTWEEGARKQITGNASLSDNPQRRNVL